MSTFASTFAMPELPPGFRKPDVSQFYEPILEDEKPAQIQVCAGR
jgi:hypothetical protein